MTNSLVHISQILVTGARLLLAAAHDREHVTRLVALLASTSNLDSQARHVRTVLGISGTVPLLVFVVHFVGVRLPRILGAISLVNGVVVPTANDD